LALEFHITAGSATPIYRQIVDHVRHGVAVGSMKAGDQLPSVRGLAEQLVRGYFIADRRQVYSDEERARRLEQALDTFISETLVLNFTADEIKQTLSDKLSRIRKDANTKRGATDG